MDLSEQKICRQSFSKLGWTLVASQFLMFAAAWAGDAIYARWLSWHWPDIDAVTLALRLSDSGAPLIFSAVCGLIPCFWLGQISHIREFPEFLLQENQRSSAVTVVFSLLLVLGLQNIASILTIPFESLANLLGGSFYEAYVSAAAVSQTPSMLFYSVLFAPFCEELLYRGFVLRYLQPYGNTFAILFAAILFGLMHGNIAQFPMALLCGALFGYLALAYSLRTSMIVHALANLVAGIVDWLSHADEIVAGRVNEVLFAFGLIAFFLCVFQMYRPIVQYIRTGFARKGIVKLLLTSPPIALLIFYLAFLTGFSITPI